LSRAVAVLVIDDNPGFRHELVSIIDDLDYVSRVQGMGAENADIIASVLVTSTDTVLIADYDTLQRAMDNAVEVWIRATTARIEPEANVRIVVLAKASDELLAVNIMKTGAADYLPKRLVSGRLIHGCLEQFVTREDSRTPVQRAAVKRAQRPKPRPLNVRLTGYEIRRKLYESREAEIYLAFSRSLEMAVVLKVVSKHTNSEVELTRFKREFETLQLMRNSSIALVYDYGETDDFAYMALEHFPAGSLKDRLRGPLGRRQAVEYLRRIATALKAVHNLNIVHRDLKPSNIMLRSDDTIALIDFGIVKEMGEGVGLTVHGELRGSPYYMSPEQASGVDIDCRSDLYSLGVVFYEMLTGQKPYVGSDLMEVLNQHLDALPPTLPNSLSGYQPLIDYMMAKDRNVRVASVEDLLNDAALQQPDNPNPYPQARRA
jgi:tRNA A-37 threonylcarbamoyl transferase component Bud32/FixJ family two-component response regulator